MPPLLFSSDALFQDKGAPGTQLCAFNHTQPLNLPRRIDHVYIYVYYMHISVFIHARNIYIYIYICICIHNIRKIYSIIYAPTWV